MEKLTIVMERRYVVFPKIDLKMKFFFLFFITVLFQSQAKTGYGQNVKIDLEMENASVFDVINKIESKTDLKFFYSKDELDENRKINIRVKKEKIDNVLNKIFSKRNIEYKIIGNQVVLKLNKITEPKKEKIKEIKVKQNLIDISGKVHDENGQPLPGANIVEKGTNNGAQTNFDGEFSLKVSSKESVLVVSYLGFKTKEVTVGTQANFNIALEEDAAGLDEVVVVGYGTQRKREITGAISSISSDAISEQTVTGFDQALVGRVSGVQVSQGSGAPGGAVSIRVRGVGTPGNSEPLYVVDGVPVFNDNNGRQGGQVGNSEPAGALNGINPNDIESIEILKDAASGAIYGSRAANGVVIITTKKGKAGEAKFNLDYSIGMQGKEKHLDVLDGPTYQEYIKTLNGLNNDPADDNPFVNPSNTDFIDEVFRTAPVQNLNLSASGGNATSNYLVSLGYFDQEGIMRGSSFERFSLRVNTNSKIGKRFRIGNNASISRSLSSKVTENDLFEAALGLAIIYPSVIPARNEAEGRLGAPADAGISFIRKNPLVNTDLLSFEAEQFRFLGNVFAEYDVLDDLTYRLNFGGDFFYGGSDSFTPNMVFPGTNETSASANRFDSREFIWLMEHTLNYNKTFGDNHTVNLLAGFTNQKSTYSSHSSSKNQYISNDVRALDAGGNIAGVSGKLVDWSLASFIGRANYNYKDKYFLSASIRKDGSSRFGPGNKWGTFPSVSAGWLVSDENFFKSDFISTFKLRSSWGQLGNQEIDPFQYLPLLINTAQYAFGGANVAGIYGAQPANEKITWETSTQLDFGIDMSFLKNKITLSIDYFDKETDGILLPGTLPLSYGYLRDRSPQFPTINAGVVSNKGFEFDLGVHGGSGDFTWSMNANLATLKNNVESLGNGGALIGNFGSRTDVGGPVGAFYGYVVDGIFQNQGEIDAVNPDAANGVYYQSSGTSPGDFKFKDLNGDGVVNNDDQKNIGSPIPDVNYGLTFSANYKNFDFSMAWQGVAGNEIKTRIFQQAGDFTKPDNKFTALYNNRWQGEGTSNTVPRIAVDNANDNYRNSTYQLHDGSYLRLRSLQIGYSLPQNILDHFNMSRLRIYLGGQNLLTITDYEFGLDPEVGTTYGRNSTTGVDIGRYPVPRTVTLGVNLGF